MNGYTLVSDKDPWKRTTIDDYKVRELQVPIFINGKLVYNEPSIKEKQEYCQREYETLTDRITDIENPHTYYVDLSDEERSLKEYMLYEIMQKSANTAIENCNYQKVKKCGKEN